MNYRESYGMFATSGILFNHESPRRGLEFVTRKITDGVAKIKLGKATTITLGNLNACRDWGYAPDFVKAFWEMLQQKEPNDYVISTNKLCSLKNFLDIAFQFVGMYNWQAYVKQDKQFMRPADIVNLIGDNTKIRKKLKWKPTTSLERMIDKMVRADLARKTS